MSSQQDEVKVAKWAWENLLRVSGCHDVHGVHTCMQQRRLGSPSFVREGMEEAEIVWLSKQTRLYALNMTHKASPRIIEVFARCSWLLYMWTLPGIAAGQAGFARNKFEIFFLDILQHLEDDFSCTAAAIMDSLEDPFNADTLRCLQDAAEYYKGGPIRFSVLAVLLMHLEHGPEWDRKGLSGLPCSSHGSQERAKAIHDLRNIVVQTCSFYVGKGHNLFSLSLSQDQNACSCSPEHIIHAWAAVGKYHHVAALRKYKTGYKGAFSVFQDKHTPIQEHIWIVCQYMRTAGVAFPAYWGRLYGLSLLAIAHVRNMLHTLEEERKAGVALHTLIAPELWGASNAMCEMPCEAVQQDDIQQYVGTSECTAVSKETASRSGLEPEQVSNSVELVLSKHWGAHEQEIVPVERKRRRQDFVRDVLALQDATLYCSEGHCGKRTRYCSRRRACNKVASFCGISST